LPEPLLKNQSLPETFQFSQSSLQDYADCQRRFQLRYIQKLAWPAIQTEPALESERFLRQGSLFHQMVQQLLVGVPAERLAGLIHDDDLARWWENFLTKRPLDLEKQSARQVEITLSAPVEGYRLAAKYDLIVSRSNAGFAIVDWKTSRQRTKRKWLVDRLQSKVYPYLLVRAGAHLNQGLPVEPEKVELVYWFAEFPEKPEILPYDALKYQQDGAYLSGLIHEIAQMSQNDFRLTSDEKRCTNCAYRSLCDRGVRAGGLDGYTDEMQSEWMDEISLNFDQIREIKF